MIRRKPPETTPQRKPSRRSVRSVVRAPGHQFQLVGDLVDDRGGQARQGGHPPLERLREIQLPAHRGLGDRRDRSLGARAGGQHLDDLALDQRRIDVEDDEPLGAPFQAVGLECHVDALVAGHPCQRGLQLATGSRRHRDPQLQAGDRIVGDAADQVDVDAQSGRLAGHRAECPRGDRPAQHHDGVGRRFPDDRHVVAALDRDVEAHRVDGGFDVVAQRGAVRDFRRAGHQHTQGEPAPDHHLFDVEQLDSVPGQHLEQRRRHTWLIHTGDGDQHRHLRWCAHPKPSAADVDVVDSR